MRHEIGLITLLVACAAAAWPAPAAAQAPIDARFATIEVGGRLHAQLAHTSAAADVPDVDLFMRRARVTLDVEVNDFLDGRVQYDFAGGGSLKDAYFRMAFADGFRVSMGQFKRPFDPFELASSTELPLVERDGRIPGVDACTGVGGVCTWSRLTERLSYADRDMGVMVDGSLGGGRVGYELAVTNGTDAEGDENDGKSFQGRVVVAVTDGVRLGGNVSVHDYQDVVDPVLPGAGESRHATAWGGDVEVGDFRDGFHLLAGAVTGDNWQAPDAGGAPASFVAVQGLASWYVPVEWDRLEAIEPAARIGWADPDTELDDDGGVLFTPGFFVYVLGRNRIGANLDVYVPDAGDTEYSFKLMTFLYF